MKNLIFLFLLLNVFSMQVNGSVPNFKVDHIEPSFWWAGMKNTDLQIMVHAKDVASLRTQINTPGIRLVSAVQTSNKNYQIKAIVLASVIQSF